MCKKCLEYCGLVFPEVPADEITNFLMATTCFPFDEPEQVHKDLVSNRSRMKSEDYRECYAIADSDLDEAMKQLEERRTKETADVRQSS